MWSHERNAVFGVNVAFFVLTWITVSLRLWVRIGMLRAFGPDDYTMLAALVFFTAYLIAQLGGVIYGTGEHLGELVPWRAERALFYWYLCEVFYALSTCILKISVGYFLLRVAMKPVHVWIIRALMILSAVLGFAFSFVLVFQCYPVSDWWSLDPTQKHCINPTVVIGLTYAVSGLNVIADWSLGILPIFVVKDLQMSKRQKKMVSGILAFAAIGSTATIVRLPYIGSLQESFDGSNGDFLYNTVGVAIWTTVEVGVGISAASLATLRPLIRLAFEKFGIGSSGNTRQQQPLSSKNRWSPRYTPDQEAFVMSTSGHRARTTTTVTGNYNEPSPRHSMSDSQERLAMSGKITTGRLTTVEYDGPDVGEDDDSLERSFFDDTPQRSKSTRYLKA